MTNDEYEDAVEVRTIELTIQGIIEMLQASLVSKQPDALRQGLREICLSNEELRERLEDWRDLAEEEIQDANPKPCCHDYHCPCGG